jgi:hypothetical protein
MAKASVALGVIATVLAGVCLFVWHQLQSSRAVSQAQLAQITEFARNTARPSAADPESAPPPDEPAPPPQSASSNTPQSDASPVNPRRMMQDPAYYRKVMQDPAYRAAMIERRVQFARSSLKNMREWVAMSDQTFEDYIALEAEQAMELGDIYPETDEERASAELARQREQMAQHHTQEMEQLFGESYPQYREWARATKFRNRIGAMNGQLSAEDAVAGTSIKTLALAMSNAEQSTLQALRAEWGLTHLGRAGSNITPDRRVEMTRRINENVRAAAEPHLSPKQLKLLDDMLKVDLDSVEASVQLQRTGLRGGGD